VYGGAGAVVSTADDDDDDGAVSDGVPSPPPPPAAAAAPRMRRAGIARPLLLRNADAGDATRRAERHAATWVPMEVRIARAGLAVGPSHRTFWM